MSLARRPRIALVSKKPSAREAKIAFALREVDIPSLLIHCEPPRYDPAPHFDFTLTAGSAEEVAALLQRAAPDVVHAFTSAFDEVVASALRVRGPKLVYDSFDYWEGLLANEIPRNLLAGQRLAVERARALCCSDLQAWEYRRANAVSRPPALFFPDYCWGAPLDWPERGDDEIHVALAGSIQIEEWTPTSFDAGSFHVIEWLCAAGVHVHLYAFSTVVTYDYPRLRKFFELSDRTPFLHLHDPVPMDRLAAELAKYDFGAHVRQGDVFPGHPPFATEGSVRATHGSRAYDYIDAGLRLLLTPSMGLSRSLFEKDGIVELWDEDFTRDPLGRLRAAKRRISRAAVARAKTRHSLAAHAGRLLAFYRRLGGE